MTLIDTIDLSYINVTLTLNEQHTLWHVLFFHLCGHVFKHWCHNNNIRYLVYSVVLFILNIVVRLSTSIILDGTLHSVSIIILLMIILDCNVVLFKQSLMTFQVYYKTINFCVALVAFNIDYHWFEDGYSGYNYNHDKILLYTIGVLSITKSVLIMFVVCVLDGYNISKYLKIFSIICVLVEYIYFYYVKIYIDYKSFDVTGSIFNHPFHWHTMANSTMTSAIAFLAIQCYLIIKKPSKLILVATFIQLSFDHNQNALDNNEIINIDITYVDTETPIALVYVNNKHTIFYAICHLFNIGDDKALKISKMLSSKYLLYVCILFLIMYGTIGAVTNYNIAGWIMITSNLVGAVIIIIFMGNYNYTISKYVGKTFAFWWKLQDGLNYVIMWTIIDYYNGSFASKTPTHLTHVEAWIVSILQSLGLVITVIGVATIKATFVKLSPKHNKWMSHATIIAAILVFVQGVITTFLSDDDYNFNITLNNDLIGFHDSVIILSCRTIVIEKGIDLSIFFIQQIYSNIQYGNDGVEITGFVQTKWIIENKVKRIHNDDQLNVQLLPLVD